MHGLAVGLACRPGLVTCRSVRRYQGRLRQLLRSRAPAVDVLRALDELELGDHIIHREATVAAHEGEHTNLSVTPDPPIGRALMSAGL
jgi:hypothetical protein